MRKCAGRLLGKETNVSARSLDGAAVDSLMADCGFRWVRRRFITYGYGNGPSWLPRSPAIRRKMASRIERWCGQRPIGRYLAWSCFCVVRKPKYLNGDAHDL